MNHLLSIRSNTYWDKIDGELNEIKEIIFLTVKPGCRLSNEQEVLRERQLNEFRVSLRKSQIDELIQVLEKVRDTE